MWSFSNVHTEFGSLLFSLCFTPYTINKVLGWTEISRMDHFSWSKLKSDKGTSEYFPIFILKSDITRKFSFSQIHLGPPLCKQRTKKFASNCGVFYHFFYAQVSPWGTKVNLWEKNFLVISLLSINIRKYCEVHSLLFNLDHEKWSIREISVQPNIDVEFVKVLN
jgi:hypothetical protein